jgi:hypothetical protein
VQAVEWQPVLEREWSAVTFSEMKVASNHETHVFRVQVSPGALAPDAVRV